MFVYSEQEETLGLIGETTKGIKKTTFEIRDQIDRQEPLLSNLERNVILFNFRLIGLMVRW